MPTRFRLSRPVRRRRGTSAPDQGDDGIQLLDMLDRAIVLTPSRHSFHMDSPEQKEELARLCWSASRITGEDSLCASNPELRALVTVLTNNTSSHSTCSQDGIVRQELQFEGVLTDLERIRSQKVMTLLTARMSIASVRAQIPRDYWQLLRAVGAGTLVSHDVAERFLDFAAQFRPSCPYEAIPGVGGVMFDNYTRRIKYSSNVTTDSAGYLLNMTNSADMPIPGFLAPPGFNANLICARHTACACTARCAWISFDCAL